MRSCIIVYQENSFHIFTIICRRVLDAVCLFNISTLKYYCWMVEKDWGSESLIHFVIMPNIFIIKKITDDVIDDLENRLLIGDYNWTCWCQCNLLVITRDSEVIMFSPCVFVCLFVCVCVVVYVCQDVCPDDLTMKGLCHTNNILQVHRWGCLVVQVMFRALMTSLMSSQDHKVGQILKLI